MNRTRAEFKYALRASRVSENVTLSDRLAIKFINSKKDLWHTLKKVNRIPTPIATCINGISGASSISEMRRDHYCSIYNSVPSNMNDLSSKIKSSCNSIDIEPYKLNTEDVKLVDYVLVNRQVMMVYVLNILSMVLKNYIIFCVFYSMLV